jgi:hypothetical protein
VSFFDGEGASHPTRGDLGSKVVGDIIGIQVGRRKVVGDELRLNTSQSHLTSICELIHGKTLGFYTRESQVLMLLKLADLGLHFGLLDQTRE